MTFVSALSPALDKHSSCWLNLRKSGDSLNNRDLTMWSVNRQNMKSRSHRVALKHSICSIWNWIVVSKHIEMFQFLSKTLAFLGYESWFWTAPYWKKRFLAWLLESYDSLVESYESSWSRAVAIRIGLWIVKASESGMESWLGRVNRELNRLIPSHQFTFSPE